MLNPTPVDVIEHIKPITEIGLQYYINVYKDQRGEIHYSSEEFSRGCDGIFSFDGALEEAYRFTIKDNWEYITTLSNSYFCKERILIKLEQLEGYRAYMDEIGKSYEHLSADELGEVVQDIIDRRP